MSLPFVNCRAIGARNGRFSMHHVFYDGRLCLFDRFCGNKRSLHLHIEIENQFSFSFHICSKQKIDIMN